jgi:hypothetical protein
MPDAHMIMRGQVEGWIEIEPEVNPGTGIRAQVVVDP